MRLEIPLMIATLLIAIAGTSDEARSYLGGTYGVVALLTLTTAGTIYLKYQAMKEAREDRKRMELLLRSSRPNEYVLELISDAFFDVRKKYSDIQAMDHTVMFVKTPSKEGVRCSWLLIGQQHELLGFWTLSEDEVADLAAYAAEDKELHRRVEKALLTPWQQSGDYVALTQKINSHISAWLKTRHEGTAHTWAIGNTFQGTPRGIVRVALEGGKEFAAEYALTEEFLEQIANLSAYRSGVAVAIMVDAWIAEASGASRTAPMQVDTGPDVSSLVKRVIGP